MIFPFDCKTSVFIASQASRSTFLNLYPRCVEVASMAKVNRKLFLTRFCIAMRAPGSELLPPKVGSIDKLGEASADSCRSGLTDHGPVVRATNVRDIGGRKNSSPWQAQTSPTADAEMY